MSEIVQSSYDDLLALVVSLQAELTAAREEIAAMREELGKKGRPPG